MYVCYFFTQKLPLVYSKYPNNLSISFFKMDVFDCADRYKKQNTPLIIIAGKDYGSGSSRDWAAKGPYLLVGLNNILSIRFSFLL